MKKIFSLLLALIGVFSLAGCKEEKPEDPIKEEIKIVLPGGAPLMSHLGIYDKSQNEEFRIAGSKVTITTGATPEQLQAAYGRGEADIIISPVNMGIKMYNAKHMYKYAANISDGNICLASTTKMESFADLAKMNIVSFGEGNVNALALKKVLEVEGIRPLSLKYLSNVRDTNTQLIADKNPNTAYLVAEPAISVAKTKLGQAGKPVYILDLLKEFKDKLGIPYLQAGIFVKDGTPEKFLNEYLEMIKSDMKSFNEDPKTLSEISNKYTDKEGQNLFGFPPAKVLEKSVKGCNLVYRSAKEARESLEKLNDLLFGGAKISEEFYL